MEIKRVPIQIPHNRRSKFNPEFLDKDFLLEKFTPLIQSLHRYFCSYAGILDQPADVADLYSQIQLEFLKLVKKYDPTRGVDFPGYIHFNLRNRVYYYVTKLQNRQNKELLLIKQEDSNEPIDMNDLWEKPDESVTQEVFRIEALASLPWDKITDESDRDLIREILVEHKTLYEISRSRRVLVKVVQQQFEDLCERLIQLYKDGETNAVLKNKTSAALEDDGE